MYRSLATGSVISAGHVTIWRSPLFVAGRSAAALFMCDADGTLPRARLEVRASQLVQNELVGLLSVGGGGGGRTWPEGGSERWREAHWMEFELPSAMATGLLFSYYRGRGQIASEEVTL